MENIDTDGSKNMGNSSKVEPEKSAKVKSEERGNYSDEHIFRIFNITRNAAIVSRVVLLIFIVIMMILIHNHSNIIFDRLRNFEH